MSQESKAMDAAPHPLRHVTAQESPWPGVLARGDDGGLVLLVDSVAYGEGAGWNADPAGHVLAPLDVVRRPDGHDVVLPACMERLDGLIARRRDRRVPLSAGERVTVAVSLLRGLRDAGTLTLEPSGAWWLTADGRPVLALGDSAATDAAPAATARLLSALSAGAEGRLAAALTRAAARAEEPRALSREAEDLEAELFACAAPEPLATAGAAAFEGRRTRARDVDDDDVDEASAESRESWIGRIAPLVDADLADAASRALTSVWRRVHRLGDDRPERGGRSRKRGPILLAGAAAAAVVGIGLVWPVGGDAPAQAGGPASPSGSASSPAPAATELPKTVAASPVPTKAPASPAVQETDAVVQAVDELLTRRAHCGNDESCLGGVQEDPARRFVEGAASLPADGRRVSLLDSFGGAAVAKVTSVDSNAPATGAAGAQLVVVVRDGDRWLIRDVYGAGQP